MGSAAPKGIGAVERALARVEGGGASVRPRVVLGILLPFIAFLPAVAVSLQVLQGVLERTDRIVQHDVQVARVTEQMAKDMLVARAALKSFLLDGAVAHFEASRGIAADFPRRVHELGGLLGAERAEVRQLGALAREYAWRTDSLLVLTVRMRARDLAGSPHLLRLDEITSAAAATAERLLAANAAALETNRQLVETFAVRARRDLLTVLILTLVAEAVMVFTLPQLLLQPLKQLTRTLQQAAQGRLEARAPVGRGEIGQLGAGINQVVEAFQESDALTRNKIVELANRFRLVAEAADCGILVLDADLKPIHANTWLLDRRGWNAPEFSAANLEALFEPEDVGHELTTLMVRSPEDRVPSVLRTPQGGLPVTLACGAVLDRSGDLANLVVFVREAPSGERLAQAGRGQAEQAHAEPEKREQLRP